MNFRQLFGASSNQVQESHKIGEMAAKLAALDKSQSVIEFDLNGTIITANDNFLAAVGYELAEIQGKHHSIFVTPEERNGQAYKSFWARLNQGEFFHDEFRRMAKGGRDIWIQATYNPLLDEHGRPYKVVKFASDITEQKLKSADFQGQINAIGKSQAVIEFNLDGTILTANDNFLSALGYDLNEIQGQHHRIFVDPSYAKSNEYRDFWLHLARGDFFSDEFERFTKTGESIWIQASYNPIFDAQGKPFKVVKYASDITAQKVESANANGQLEAINKAQAIIEFNLDGTIITANDNFLNVMGYSLKDIQGKHHSMFVTPEHKTSAGYRSFWQRLNHGQFESAEYKRVANGGREIWILASYNPIFDPSGKVYKIVKFASDVTAQKLKNADFEGQISAIGKSQAVIEFNMDGTIRTANDNFCDALGYRLEEIQGQHHSMFVEPNYKNSRDYQAFWEGLSRGEFASGEYKRLAKGGREIWIQASYNPIFDLNGKPFKVVKYATDVTAQKSKNSNFEGQIDAISKSQAVIEFNMDGSIITANENFLKGLGYHLDEIQGQHHSMFVDKAYSTSDEYRQFWEQLRRGEFSAGQYPRVNKQGSEIWIQASYNPIFDLNGRPYKVVKYATDITAQKVAVDAVSKTLLAMSEGDISARIHEELEGEFAELKTAMNSTLERLSNLVSDISEGAGHVTSSAEEIQSGTSDLSQRTEEQASSLEETVATMEELTSTVEKNAENAAHANALASGATTRAEQGGAVVGKAISAMSEIETASKKISDIIGVIDEIAFQTNLLALNAAVEAARAGEQGRGFAVVAGEVRNLAQRSAGAAKEIKGLIQDSVGKVAEGTRLVNESGKTLGSIVGEVQRVSQLISEIDGASKEQSLGINQVNSTIAQMDSMTQQNAAMVEQASAASGSMADQAGKLMSQISFFRT